MSGIGTNSQVQNPESIHDSQFKVTTYDADSMRGSQSAKETVVEGNGVYLSVVKDKSDSETSETLRESEAYLTEWDSSWVEIWVNTQEAGTDIANVKVDLGYDPAIFKAVGVEYSSFVKNGLEFTIDAETGTISNLGGDLTQTVTREDGFVLLGRVQLAANENGGVAADTINSASMGLVLKDVTLRDSEQTRLAVNTKVFVNTEVFAVVYDANDDGQINIQDLVKFAKMYGTNTTLATDARAWAMDFDNSGTIDIRDLTSFAKNYGKHAGGTQAVVYPKNFFQTWIGTNLKTDGTANVTDTLHDAIDAWSESLGESLNLDVQIIVKDYENVDGGILGETIILDCDAEGKPNTAVVYLDSDALGLGWYVGESANVTADQYDLYTVLLHELGHALGMSNSYDGYRETISSSLNFTSKDGNSYLVFNGHVYADGDLMNDTIDPGKRLEISDVDVEILTEARKIGSSVQCGSFDAACGSVSISGLSGFAEIASAPAECLTVTVSSIVEEETWNRTLMNAAVQTVENSIRKQERLHSQLNDAAWSEWTSGSSFSWVSPTTEKEETVESILETDLNEDPISEFQSVSENAELLDGIFEEEDFTDQFAAALQEPLNIPAPKRA